MPQILEASDDLKHIKKLVSGHGRLPLRSAASLSLHGQWISHPRRLQRWSGLRKTLRIFSRWCFQPVTSKWIFLQILSFNLLKNTWNVNNFPRGHCFGFSGRNFEENETTTVSKHVLWHFLFYIALSHLNAAFYGTLNTNSWGAEMAITILCLHFHSELLFENKTRPTIQHKSIKWKNL